MGAASCSRDTAGGEGAGWSIDLHCVAASKPSPYLPFCVVAGKHSPESTMEESGGNHQHVRVNAWCDRAGREMLGGEDPVVLFGEQEVTDPDSSCFG